MKTIQITITGIVQGVGFRPFLYRQAQKHRIKGSVRNSSGAVIVSAQGSRDAVKSFIDAIHTKAPVLAKVDSVTTKETEEKVYGTFAIQTSTNTSCPTTLLSPDIKTCDACRAEIFDPASRFYGYFATNCTECGPRYSIIENLPYDRSNTSMREFVMCSQCKKEYEDPANRRFHAQPVSCPECGPKLTLTTKEGQTHTNTPQKSAQLLRRGQIGAIKGVGGVHLVCDAANASALRRLRKAKNRPHKPFALMCKDIARIQTFAHVGKEEKALLQSPQAPIVVLDKSDEAFAPLVAPDIDKIGCMLPSAGQHFLLFAHFEGPIVATSANLGGEPLCIKASEVRTKLPFVDFILDYNRDIINAVDDSLVQVIGGKTQILRGARGFMPLSLRLPKTLEKPVLGTGGHQKSTISFATGDNLILSPHIGDLDTVESISHYKQMIQNFTRFYKARPVTLVSDLHQGYASTQWAQNQGSSVRQVQHHKAHIDSVKAEFGLQGEFVSFVFDGTGLGEDETLWGGEVFLGDKRIHHFKPLKLLGADKAIKEPRRVALSLLLERFDVAQLHRLELPTVDALSQSELSLLAQAHAKNLNAPQSSSAARLFDAVASLCGLLQKSSYEGQSGLLCEAAYDAKCKECFDYDCSGTQIMIDLVGAFVNNHYGAADACSRLINTLAAIITTLAKRYGRPVILSGGVFQNKTLLQTVLKQLQKENIPCYFNQKVPINDGGISAGQVWRFVNDLS